MFKTNLHNECPGQKFAQVVVLIQVLVFILSVIWKRPKFLITSTGALSFGEAEAMTSMRREREHFSMIGIFGTE